MTLQERGKRMFAKGYRYCIVFAESSNIEPLFVKTLAEIGPLMRNSYPNESGWRGYEIDSDGNEVEK